MKDYIEKNYKLFLTIGKRYQLKDDYRDIVNEVCLELMELPIEKQTDILGRGIVTWYFVKMFKLNAFSKNSRYQRKYNLLQFDTIEDEFTVRDEILPYDDLYDRVEAASVTELDWYSKRIFDIHVSGVSFKKMAEETGIPSTSLWITFNSAKDKIKSKLEKDARRES